VIGQPISVIGSEQGPALGSALHAAVAAGVHADVYAAAAAMGRLGREVYTPDGARHRAYDELYGLYGTLHDYFGREQRSLMRRLQTIREHAARTSEP
jgi:L-ribulokinase